MLSIAQAYRTFYFLYWIPSENGPLVTRIGDISIKNIDLRNTKSYLKVINSILSGEEEELPIITFSIDAEKACFSESQLNQNVEHQKMLQWHINQMVDQKFLELNDTYSYFLNPEELSTLNIHILKSYRKSISEAMKELNGEVRMLGLGIFSAEICARECFQADEHESYAIWRLGRYNTDEVLMIDNSNLRSYFRLKRTKDQTKIINNYGNSKLSNQFAEEVDQCFRMDLKIFSSTKMVYVYQNDGKHIDVKNIIESDIANVRLLNPLTVVNVDSGINFNKYQTSPLAETGLTFRGVDV